jgi:hypothetical protein
MVVPAQEDEVVQRGRTAVRPVSYVMSVGPLWTTIAARVDAAAVAHGERGADGRWDDAGPTADVERLADGIEDDPDDRGVTGDPSHTASGPRTAPHVASPVIARSDRRTPPHQPG